MIRKRIGLIAMLTIFLIVIVGLVSYFVLTPVYEATTEILVNESPGETDQLSNENIQANLQLAKTYTGILENPIIFNQVRDEMGLDITIDKLSEKVIVTNAEQSQLITITARDKDPEMAAELVNTTASVFEDVIREIVAVDNITLLSPAIVEEDPVPVFPKPLINMAIAGIVGLLLGLGIVLLQVSMNKTKEQSNSNTE